MINRIVKLTLKEDSVSEFLELFEDVKSKIILNKGCNGVKLLQDTERSNVVFTYSLWDSVDDLNNYRKSELFGITWKKTKSFFSDNAEAWSTHIINES